MRDNKQRLKNISTFDLLGLGKCSSYQLKYSDNDDDVHDNGHDDENNDGDDVVDDVEDEEDDDDIDYNMMTNTILALEALDTMGINIVISDNDTDQFIGSYVYLPSDFRVAWCS